MLHVDGRDAVDYFKSTRDELSIGEHSEEDIVILGDASGMTEEEIHLVLSQPETVQMVSLGKLPLLASQCVVLVNHYLDE